MHLREYTRNRIIWGNFKCNKFFIVIQSVCWSMLFIRQEFSIFNFNLEELEEVKYSILRMQFVDIFILLFLIELFLLFKYVFTVHNIIALFPIVNFEFLTCIWL